MINEDALEQLTLEWFNDLGYEYKHGNDIAPGSESQERDSVKDVILDMRLRSAIERLNRHLPVEALKIAFDKFKTVQLMSLIERNKQVYSWIKEGIPIEYNHHNEVIGDRVKLIDFDDVDNNDFLVVNQLYIKERKPKGRIPDVVVYVNGLPLSVIELKNPADEDADVWAAYDQIQTYLEEIPTIFETNLSVVVSDGAVARIGSITAPKERFMPWRFIKNEQDVHDRNNFELETLIKGFFEKSYLLEFLRNYVLFLGEQKISKIIAAYHQFHGVRAAVANTLKTVLDTHDGKIGVYWHTQGSGKSFSALFYSGIVMTDPRLNNPTILVVTDRNDLDGQLYEDFAGASALLKDKPIQIESREDLVIQLLNKPSGGVVFTTIQKFAPAAGSNTYPILSQRRNIIVITDEAHRTQYGTKAKLDLKTGETTYGYAKYLRDAFPNASFMGLTGTPVSENDRDTRSVFGDYVSVYDIEDAVKDGSTVPLHYEARLVELATNDSEVENLDEMVDDLLEGEELEESNKSKSKWTALEALVTSESRIKKIAQDFVTHFESRQTKVEGKAMVVCISRQACASLYKEIIELRPEWHDDELNKGSIKVVMTSSASDGPELAKHNSTKQDRETLAKRFKDPEDPLKIVLIRDMWLTGFDAPSVHTLYIDKPMKGANLMQAIARANRVFKDKPGGLIVDYIGIATQLKEALYDYTKAKGKGSPVIDTEEAVTKLIDTMSLVRNMLYDVDYSGYSEPKTALKLIPKVMNHIAGLPIKKDPNSKSKENPAIKQYLDLTLQLSKAQTLSGEHPRAVVLREEIAFLMAVRSSLYKNTFIGGHNDQVFKDHALKQLVSKSVYAGEIIDIYDQIGVRHPDISILDENFLEEIKHMEYKNLAVELLERLLADKIKARGTLFTTQEKKFSDLLATSLIKYRNRSIETSQVIEEMIQLALDLNNAVKRGEELGLDESEFAFYEALEDNESAAREMSDEELKKIAIELTKKLRQSVTVDFKNRDSVQARLRLEIKRILRTHKYPPNKQPEAIEKIMKQTEAIAMSWLV
jgi:type I restriction enzyme R subunit